MSDQPSSSLSAVPVRGLEEHVHQRSYVDEACDCWRCECSAWMPRDKKAVEPLPAVRPQEEA